MRKLQRIRMCAVDFGVVAANKNKGQSMEKDGEAAE